MTAATISGTTGSPARGWAFNGTDPITLEPAGGLSVTVTVQAGAPVERLRVDGHDEPSGGGWRQYDVGESFEVAEGERVLLRPRGQGGAGVTFEWHGEERLARLRSYTGGRGSRDA